MNDFDFEIDEIVRAVEEGKHSLVLLQFPEGLKRRGFEVAEEIARRVPDADVVISGEECYGACDLPYNPGGLTVNFGHYPIPSLRQMGDVLFIPARSSAEPEPVLEKALPELSGIVGIVSTPQHIHQLGQMVDFLAKNNVRAVVGQGNARLFKEGQVLGCNVSAARNILDKVDMFLFVGTGNFHPLALALGTKKKIIIADPIVKEIRKIDELKDKILRQRHAVIQQAKDADNFGIILSTKAGQRRETLAIEIKNMLAESGKKAALVEIGNISPQKLDAFGADAWISTACPRLAIDDYLAYNKPILTPPELEILLGQRDWDDYLFDEIS